MRFDKGFLSQYFVTDPERQEAVFEDPYILIVNQKISNIKDLLPIVDKVIQAGKQLLIIAEDVDGEALATLVRQQDPRHLQVGRRQGSRLRRPSQGAAAGHRDPHRWPGHQRGGRSQARERHPRPARPGPQGHRHQGRDHDHRGRRRGSADRRSRQADPSPRSRTPTATTTARSSRSASRSSPAASPSSRPVPRPRSS